MKSKAKLIALAGILGITGIGGTFAYFSQVKDKENVFKTGTYNTEIVEVFVPRKDWEPGTSVEKKVTVKNSGSLAAVARVKFVEQWVRTSDQKVLYEIDSTKNLYPVDPVEEGKAQNKFENVYQSHTTDGKTGTDVDDSVVEKVLNPSEWIYNKKDGYYYYKYTIPAGEESDLLLSQIRLAEDIDMGNFVEKRYYATTDDETTWVEFDKATVSEASPSELRYLTTQEQAEKVPNIKYMKNRTELSEPELTGYSDADYMLRIEVQTVQATDQAVDSVFGENTCVMASALGCEWALVDESQVYYGDPATPATASVAILE